jgi:LPS-assembly lipoprotein
LWSVEVNVRHLHLPALAAVLFTLAGCGFHLRGYDLPSSVASVRIETSGRNLLAEPLRRALREAGVSTSADNADAVVELLSEERSRRSAAVTGNARVAEYQLTLGVLYRLRDGAGQETLPAQWARVERIYRLDRENLVGSSEEQALLEKEMQADLVQQILRTLTAVTQAAGAASAAG